ncbi:MAG TPA: hypothetical protein VNW29_01570 [Candidatus Sulfotelmatobacter sp.]|jgi:hypothetical protein|nr:hypothetical protein [Candidatus Sulfotelmatobacter sp.]
MSESIEKLFSSNPISKDRLFELGEKFIRQNIKLTEMVTNKNVNNDDEGIAYQVQALFERSMRDRYNLVYHEAFKKWIEQENDAV